MTPRWLAGLLRRRAGELAGAAASIALAVAFIASLGAFVTTSRASLTERAIARIPVDWQVQVTPQGDPAAVAAALRKVPDVSTLLPVGLASMPSLAAAGSGGVRTTGRAVLVSLAPGYAAHAPGEIRYLLGARSGVLLQQQTAANLAAGPGSTVTIGGQPGRRVKVRVDGVVDLPQADSFFQVVGTAPGAGASAPPDNVVILPHALFAKITAGTTVTHQVHVRFGHTLLPTDPAAAATAITQRAAHFEVAVAGGALVGNNLGAALSSAREDAIYAQLLFWLLGLPGLALAVVVASLVVALRADRRRREVALLQLRGATPVTLLRLLTAEALLTAVAGIAVGIPLARLAIALALPAGATLSVSWTVAAAAAGLLLAGATQLAPAARTIRAGGVEQVAVAVRALPSGKPLPLRLGLDYILLAAAAVATYLAARSGYQVVVVPEGVPVSSVNYAALLGPALAWPGLALLIWRLGGAAMARRTGRFARQTPGRAPELEAAGVRRRRHVISRGATGLAAALGLAASTAIFTATYNAQSRLDVALTVGADVAVTEPPGANVGPGGAAALRSAPGVQAVEPLQHRLGYVGPDLQDLYGIRPNQIGRVAPLRDSYVPGSTIRAALHSLGTTPDGVLLSAETIKDYQLRTGDLIRLRLQTGADRRYRPVPFHVVGLVTEFPTAPKDSFIIANAAYLTKTTHSAAVGSFLIRSSDPTGTAAALRQRLGGAAQIADIQSARRTVTSASGLAATDLTGLARLELGFGLVLALACSGLALALGITERRRALVLLGALGASHRQRRRFLAAEARALLTVGLLGGATIGAAISYLLVKVLTGIFDPPPSTPTVPGTYLAGLTGAVLLTSALVLVGIGRLASRLEMRQLRDL
ncbi:MAG: ABC transporter permease [Mycobacteriales bacterium]